MKDGGRKWLFHLPMKQQRVSSAGEEMLNIAHVVIILAFLTA